MELAEVVGSLTALQRFPIEPLGGEAPNAAPVGGAGLLGDRAYDLCDRETGAPLTSAGAPLLLFYGARYADDLVMENLDSWTRVRDPGGAECPLTDPRWLEELSETLGRVVVLKARPPAADGSPLRLVSRPTLRLAERTYGCPLEPLRVRANLVIDIPDGKAFEEDRWVGQHLRIGDTLLEVTRPADDCFLASFRPEIARGDPAMLEGLVKVRGGHMGVAIRAVSGHRVRVGDPVCLVD
ncbi:MAG: MOSC domain-containing protein [Acidobacteria bacterium]|nr:MOSC domain-containing protein [Acidobacteriota bacterium]